MVEGIRNPWAGNDQEIQGSKTLPLFFFAFDLGMCLSSTGYSLAFANMGLDLHVI